MVDTSETSHEFSDWLNAEMVARGFKQVDLGRKSGVSRAQISRILNGTAEGMNLKTLVKILTFLGYRLDMRFER